MLFTAKQRFYLTFSLFQSKTEMPLIVQNSREKEWMPHKDWKVSLFCQMPTSLKARQAPPNMTHMYFVMHKMQPQEVKWG